jgi:trigger factor
MSLKIETTPLPGSRLEIRVQADAEEIEKAYDRVFSQLQQEARIPGFRPGRAPRALLERRLAADSLRRLAWHSFLEKAYAPALEELKIEPYGEPEFPDLDEWEGFQRGQDLDMTVTWTVYPRPELPDYLHLKLVKPSAEVSEEDLDEQLQAMREAHAKQQPTDREIVQEGDAVTAHVVVFRPGTDEILDETEVELIAEKESEDDLKKAVVGAVKGQEFETTLELGYEQVDPDLVGDEARAQVRVDEIAERILPELDADFAKTIDDSLDSVDALREYVRERLTKQREKLAEGMVRGMALGLVDAGTRMELPPAMINEAATGELRRYTRQMLSGGMTPERIRDLVADRETGLADAVLRETVSDLRTLYIEDAIAREQNLEVTEEDMERALAEYAEEHGIDVPTLRQMVEVQTHTEAEFRDRARRLKIMDLLVAHAEIEEVPWEAFPLRSRRLVEEAVEGRKGGSPQVRAEAEEPGLSPEALEEEEAEEEDQPTSGEPAEVAPEESQ